MNILDLKVHKKRWHNCLIELERYLGRKISNFEEDFNKACRCDESSEASLYNVSDHSLLSLYYSQTSKYIFELLRWEATFDKLDNYRRLYLFIKKNKLINCLDFGAGIGGLCIYLADNNVVCDYADVAGKTFEFAKYRFLNRGMSLSVFDTLKSWPDKKYDVIFAYDVVEHIPNLENTVNRISRLLNKGGYFVVKPTFSGKGLHLQENEKYLDMNVFNRMMEKNNLLHLGRIKNSFFSDLLKFLHIRAITGIRIKTDRKYGGDFLIYRKKEGANE